MNYESKQTHTLHVILALSCKEQIILSNPPCIYSLVKTCMPFSSFFLIQSLSLVGNSTYPFAQSFAVDVFLDVDILL